MSDSPPAGADAVIAPRVPAWLSRLRAARLRRRGAATGTGLVVGRGVRVSATGGSRIVLGDGCVLGPGCRLEAAGGNVTVGAGARLGERCVVVALAGVAIADGASIGEWAVVADAQPGFADAERAVREQPPQARPLTVGAGARIGAHAAVHGDVAPGAVVGSYTVAPLTSA